jgi:hypothetical protein
MLRSNIHGTSTERSKLAEHVEINFALIG